jgi:hypothetical protein
MNARGIPPRESRGASMPLEYRLIQFREKEIEEIVDRWLRANGELGQYGRAGSPSITENTEKRVFITVECWDISGRHKTNFRQRTLDGEEISQAIVLFCKDHSIPLARQGRKAVRMLDGHVSMYYQLS